MALVSEKLREQVIRTIHDDEEGINGDTSPVKTPSVPNGHDVDMTPEPIELKLEDEAALESDLISPDESETNPPAPAVFRIADLKREVEAVRDKRKMIRLGPHLDESKAGPSSTFLPSVVAFTVFDGGEG